MKIYIWPLWVYINLRMLEFFCNFALFFENRIENEYSEIWMVWHSRNGSLPHECVR